MNTLSPNDPTPPDYAAFLAIDWADQKHVWSLQAAGQTKKETGTLEQKPEVIGPWVAQLRARFSGGAIAIAVEQSRGALIHALLQYDFIVIYPLNPTTVAKFRQAFKASGAKSDPLDTDQILQILTKHLDLLKPLRPDTQETRLLARLVEDRRSAVNLRTRHLQAALASLKEYFPQAITLCSSNLNTDLAYDLLQKWPTLAEFQQAKPATITRFFHAHNIRSQKLLDAFLDLALHAHPLTTDSAIVESGWRLTHVHLEAIHAFNPVIADYDTRIAVVFGEHPEAPLFRHLPGAGPVMAPRLAAFFGTDRSRYAEASNLQSFCGIAPVTKSSGHTRVVFMRRACPKFARQTMHEFARLTLENCQWARNYVDHQKARGIKYHTIIRALAFKWIRILFRCWQNHTPYDDTKYMDSLKKHGSIFATLHEKKT